MYGNQACRQFVSKIDPIFDAPLVLLDLFYPPVPETLILKIKLLNKLRITGVLQACTQTFEIVDANFRYSEKRVQNADRGGGGGGGEGGGPKFGV